MRLILSSKKASGFGSAISLLFIFILTISMIGTSFFFLIDDARQKSEIIERNKESIVANDIDFELSSPYYSSGRLTFTLNNTGSEKLFFKDDFGKDCFSIFVNNVFIDEEDYYVNLDAGANLDYSFIDEGDFGLITLMDNFNFSDNVEIKTVSCSGKTSYYEIETNELDWWDESWGERSNIVITNPSNYSLNEYQVLITLNSSNFNFDLGRENDVRFIVPTYENYLLSLSFDDYAQQLIDYSKYSNTVNLGLSSSSESSDPASTRAVLNDGLNFDGLDDFLFINYDDSLNISKDFTLSLWVKWDLLGDTTQYLFSSGDSFFSTNIINNGFANDDRLRFVTNISGVSSELISNQTIDNDWHHLVFTYNDNEMKIFIDSILSGNTTVGSDLLNSFSNITIGSQNDNSNFFNGSIDELKLFNYALDQSDVTELYKDNLRFKELDYFIIDWSGGNEEADIYLKLPSINPNSNVTVQLYYQNSQDILSLSNIESTFSYSSPRLMGYVNSDRISGTTGLALHSLYDNNTIVIGDDTFELDRQSSTTMATGLIESNDEVRVESLAQIEGGGQADDIINPVSWASTEFYFRGFRPGTDRFCLLSPWGNAVFSVLDAGVLEFNSTVGSDGTCFNMDITTASSLNINSTIPILASHVTAQDAFVLFPAVNESLYGSPSGTMYVGAGSDGASISWVESDLTTGSATLGAYGSNNQGGNPTDGASNAYRVDTTGLIGVIQQADGDGSESSVFAPKREFGTKFGTFFDTDYIAVVSDASDANCSVYDSSDILVGNVTNGIGGNGIFKYDFGTGNDNLYVLGGWRMDCQKPVWPYYENRPDNDDETNLLGHVQMKQYVYPEPTYQFN